MNVVANNTTLVGRTGTTTNPWRTGNALRIKSTNTSNDGFAYANSPEITNLIAEREYVLSFWWLVNEQGATNGSPQVIIEGKTSEGWTSIKTLTQIRRMFYIHYVEPFSLPVGLDTIRIRVGFINTRQTTYSADMLIDGISIVGSNVVQPAEPLNLIKNSGFETLGFDNSPDNWLFYTSNGAAFGTNYRVETNEKHIGNNVLEVNGIATGNLLTEVSQRSNGIFGGAKYEFNMSIKKVTNLTNISLRVEYFTHHNAFTTNRRCGSENIQFNGNGVPITADSWQTVTLEFTAPQDAAMVVISIRMSGVGTYCLDDLSFICIDNERYGQINKSEAEKAHEKEYTLKPLLTGEGEKIINGSFENWNSTFPENWTKSSAGSVQKSGNIRAGTIGSNCLILTGSGSPYVTQTISGLAGKDGYECQLSAWIKIVGSIDGNGFGFKFEGWTSSAMISSYGSKTLGYVTSTNDEWQRVVFRFTIPKGVNIARARIQPRIFGSGTAYVDDVSCYITADADGEPFKFLTDQIFYYSDREENGKATIDLKVDAFPEYLAYTADFEFCNGDEVLLKQDDVTFSVDNYKYGLDYALEGLERVNRGYNAKTAVFEFPMSLFTSIGHEYTVKAVVKNTKGNIIKSFSQKVNLYDRPTKLNKDGTIDG